MSVELESLIQAELRESSANHALLQVDPELQQKMLGLAVACADCISKSGVIFFAGNGGSFADAQHMAAELVGKMNRIRRPLSSLVLGSNSSAITAISNDFGYREVFSREFRALHRTPAVIVGFTTSARSENLVALAEDALSTGVLMTCFAGQNEGVLGQSCEVIRVPSSRTERIQEMHTFLGHLLCLLIEELLGQKEPNFFSL